MKGPLSVLFVWFMLASLSGQPVERPMIWVRPGERRAILDKIDRHPPVARYYAALQARLAGDLTDWEADPETYFSTLPTDEDGQLKTYTSFRGQVREEQQRIKHLLQSAVDGGVLYYLTREERYAAYAADVLSRFVHLIHALPKTAPGFNSGWVYPDDHLREAREIGAQLPVIYDFVYPWLIESEREFDFTVAEAVFRHYAEMVLTRGGTGTNWPILEASSLVGNALALSDPAERDHYLRHFLEKSTNRQDALPKIGAFYTEHGGSWPESTNYSQHVGEYLTYLFTLLTHHDPASDLVGRYPQVVAALPEAYYLTYPGGTETILFGDGHREYHPMTDGYEMAYHLGVRQDRPDLRATFGPLINQAVESGNYRRFDLPGERNYGAVVYREPTRLLWFEAEVPTPAGDYPLPVTAELPFAGLTLQRNLSPTGEAEDGLMACVGGGAYVHGHASGMSLELFGKGYVLGSKGGRGKYRTDIHENYYRLFASNNTVVVNGASRSNGGWVNLGTDRVQRLSAEPAPGAEPVSGNHSFTTTAFRDTVGTKAEAYQERTVGIVRTSDTTGYYVDVFRSRSALPEQYHDYIYRNVADRLKIDAPLRPTPDRYISLEAWRKNRAFRHPGWHVFREVHSSEAYAEDVTATFVANKLEDRSIGMRAFIPGQSGREYSMALSPPFTEGPRKYRANPAPTLIVRQQGSAWDRPFAVVYEPMAAERSHIRSVGHLGDDRFHGLKVRTAGPGGEGTQLILSPDDPDRPVENEALGYAFRGRYAVLHLDERGRLRGVYIGEGTYLRYRGRVLHDTAGPTSVFLNP